MRDIVAGAALGALIGLLVGLATSTVVGSVVAGLVALIATFFGLQDSDARLPSATPPRVAAFSIAAVLAVLVGISMRANDVLAPDIQSRVRAWEGIGFGSKISREIVAFERLGIVPGSWIAPEGAFQAAVKRSERISTALYASQAATSCGVLTGRDYPTASALAKALEVEGGVWKRFVESIPTELSNDVRKGTLRAAIELVCKEE